MKKVITMMFIALPLFVAACSKEMPNTSCGCDGKSGEILSEVDATVEYVEGGFLRIFITDSPTMAYILCNLDDNSRARLSIDKLKIKISGEVKPLCPDARHAGIPLFLTKFEEVK
jgi:hypothetical protein